MSALTVTDPELLAFAEEVGELGPVAIEGGRSRWLTGGQLDADTRLLRAPSGIVDYRPEEMTVKVRAGTPVADLDAALAASGQRCALPSRGGTVGGAVAVGENHLCTLGRGSVRNAVLQVRYVSAEGQVVTGGGPVVKNVSGFNLPKLMVGALGTLGLLVEVVLRTNPMPAVRQWLHASEADPAKVQDVLLKPSALLWNGADTWVLLEGHEADVRAERSALAVCGAFEHVDGPPALPDHRWSVAASAVGALQSLGASAFVASVGVGTAWASSPQPARRLDPGASAIAARMKKLFDPTARLNPGRDPGSS